MNSCNSNSCNLKDHLNRTNSLVPSKFTSKPLQENSFNSNSHNSKNHANFRSRGRIFHHVIRILVSESSFFHPSIFYCGKFGYFNSNAIIFECFEIFKFVSIRLLVADATKMATKRKHHEVTLKVKYEALKELEKGRPNKGVANQFSIPGSTLATWKKNEEKSLKLFKIHH